LQQRFEIELQGVRDAYPQELASLEGNDIARRPIKPPSAQKPNLHKNLSGLGIGLPMKIATDDF
jgi:hypothetical protein